MKCQYSSMMECYKITYENAKFVLEKMGFGEQLCEHCEALFGCYAVQDAEEGWIAMSEKEFLDNYELVEDSVAIE